MRLAQGLCRCGGDSGLGGHRPCRVGTTSQLRQIENRPAPSPGVEYEVLGYPPDAPTLRLDHERFAYAGKFVMSDTGKAVARDPGDPVDSGERWDTPVGVTSFSEHHDQSERARIRYVTVREDRRGEGVGSRLLRFTADTLAGRFEAVAIAVNNPIAYQAAYRAGFVWTGRETGMAELLLLYDPGGAATERYRAGFEVFERRDLPDPYRAVIERHADRDPPPLVDVPERT
jgi:GNAT superfamily N-acetyltransferase